MRVWPPKIKIRANPKDRALKNWIEFAKDKGLKNIKKGNENAKEQRQKSKD